MLVLILEAAFRSLLMAVAVWAGIRLFRLHQVLAQKLAWVLVLAAAAIMPLAMRTPLLTPLLAHAPAIRIPTGKPLLTRIASAARSLRHQAQTLAAVASKSTIALPSAAISVQLQPSATPSVAQHSAPPKPKPSAARLAAALPAALPAQENLEDSASSEDLDSAGNPTNSVRRPSPVLVSRASSAIHNPSWTARTLMLYLAPRIGVWAAAAYLVVGALLLLRVLVGLSLALRIWLRAKPAPELDHSLAARFGNPPHIRVSPDLATPVTIGSSILLPAGYQSWDASRLRIVLAHEQSHVRQKDFYLQLAAALHTAIFWFSPLGWWLQRKLSELGEALSDRAGLAEASDPADYAQILLDFAAMPHPTFAGVAMARHNNLSVRIERILNVNRFRLAFLGSRAHTAAAALLAPAALLAALTLIRIVPSVQAAQSHAAHSSMSQSSAGTGQGAGSSSGAASSAGAGPTSGALANQANGDVAGEVNGEIAGQITATDPTLISSPNLALSAGATAGLAQAAPPSPAAPPAPHVEAPEPPEPPEAPEGPETPEIQAPAPPSHSHSGFAYINNGDDQDSFAILDGPHNQVHTSGRSEEQLQKARKLYHDNFIWIEHDGKSYVITDPSLLARGKAMFEGDSRIEQAQARLQQQQAELQRRMAELDARKVEIKVNSTEFKQQIAQLERKLAELQNIKIKELNDKITQETLSNLQEKMGDIQGQIGEIQGRIGEKYGELGEKQGALGEQMGKLGEEMGRLGEEQGKRAEEAARKFQSILDQAIKDGKAKPID
jgi:beta-lactamase regulating signal transducer with metallopeptidase domain/uncharacterized coiled-coil protein SlyX